MHSAVLSYSAAHAVLLAEKKLIHKHETVWQTSCQTYISTQQKYNKYVQNDTFANPTKHDGPQEEVSASSSLQSSDHGANRSMPTAAERGNVYQPRDDDTTPSIAVPTASGKLHFIGPRRTYCAYYGSFAKYFRMELLPAAAVVGLAAAAGLPAAALLA